MKLSIQKICQDNKSDFYKIHCRENKMDWCHCVAWWCSTWDEFKQRTAEQNKDQREALFAKGQFDGYFFYVDGEPAGWGQVGPRDRLQKLRKQYDFAEDDNIFAISCFSIIPKFRGKGLIHNFLTLILDDLKQKAVVKVHAFPKRNTDDPWTGPESIFIKAGFSVLQDGEKLVYVKAL